MVGGSTIPGFDFNAFTEAASVSWSPEACVEYSLLMFMVAARMWFFMASVLDSEDEDCWSSNEFSFSF